MDFSEVVKVYHRVTSTMIIPARFKLVTQHMDGVWTHAEGQLGGSTISGQTALSSGETPWLFFRSASEPPNPRKLKLTLNVSSFTPSSAGSLEAIGEPHIKFTLTALRASGDELPGELEGPSELTHLLICEDSRFG